jgi:hypothetical protein
MQDIEGFVDLRLEKPVIKSEKNLLSLSIIITYFPVTSYKSYEVVHY